MCTPTIGIASCAFRPETTFLTVFHQLRMATSTDALINCMPMKCGVLLNSGEFIHMNTESKKSKNKYMMLNGWRKLIERNRQSSMGTMSGTRSDIAKRMRLSMMIDALFN